MHLLATRPGGYASEEGVVDLGQSPGDVVLLSAADTDLSLLAHACEELPPDAPPMRLGSLLALRSHASVDLYVDRVLRHARLVVASIHGGSAYWRYGVEQLAELASPGKLDLALVPGDDTFDPELATLSTVAAADLERIWRYLREGGPDNARALLSLVLSRFFSGAELVPEPRVLPRVSLYHSAGDLDTWLDARRAGRPVAALVFYRSHLQCGNLAAIDALVDALDDAGLEPLPIAIGSLKDPHARDTALGWLTRAEVACVLNTTAFAANGFDSPEDTGVRLGKGPVFQVIHSGGNAEDWRQGSFGLAPSDLAMNVVIPEVDGRIITRAVSFKDRARWSERTQTGVVGYVPDTERGEFVAALAAGWTKLAWTEPAQRRIALVLANYPTRDGRMGNGVGLDTPASTLEILRALAAAGYATGHLPATGDDLMRALADQITNDPDAIETRPCRQSLALEDYRAFLETLDPEVRTAADARWGTPERDPMVRAGRLMVSGIRLGNIFVGVQPARGYQLDPAATYHDPDLVPPHGYLAFYAWLRYELGVHAIVHVGKHGNLEWLPGKSVALGPECWPDAALGPMPHLYPFIVNDPGEGTQAKRRAQAVIVDHLVPPLTRAETYGDLRELERLVDEYYHALVMDPPRAREVRRRIRTTARAAHLDRELDCGEDAEDQPFLTSLDSYLCELKEAQIRDGLHVFGRSPEGELRADTLASLTRVPAPGRASPLQALSRALLGEGFDPLGSTFAEPWTGARPERLAGVSGDPWRTAGDTRERLELLVRAILAGDAAPPAECREAFDVVRREVGPALDACGPREIAGVLTGLDGRFVEPGPSGAPSRGRLDVLPTGRNFYSVDVRAVPTRAAFALAERAANRLLQRHVQDHGELPRCIGLSIWATSTMRTGGDDVAQALALLGVRPVWEEESGRVIDTEILPLAALGRPRVDIVLRISGMFRDAFPDLIRLVDAAVRAVADLDEPEAQNPLAGSVARETRAGIGRGLEPATARRHASWRVFGSKPGAYGAGLQGVIDQRCWTERRDLAEAYLRWSGFAYGANERGAEARAVLETRLAAVDGVLHNQDNREHDVLDSDDYYQFQGGMAAAVEQTRGAPAALYHGDHANPESPRVRSLQEEIARVVRSRVVNPKWLAGIRRHGYKGAAEMAATVDYLFGYDAATGVVADYQYALVADAFLLDDTQRAFIRASNPSALREMAERLIEAMQRGMWRDPGAHREQLESLLLDCEEGAS